jgi:hypothetical protein
VLCEGSGASSRMHTAASGTWRWVHARVRQCTTTGRQVKARSIVRQWSECTHLRPRGCCCCQHCCCWRRWRGLRLGGYRCDCHDPCVIHSSFVRPGVMRRRERRMKSMTARWGDSVVSERAPHQMRGDRKCGKRMTDTVTVVWHHRLARERSRQRASKQASMHARIHSSLQ